MKKMVNNLGESNKQTAYTFDDIIITGFEDYSIKDVISTNVFKLSSIVAFILATFTAVYEYLLQPDEGTVELLVGFLPLSLQITVPLAALSLAGMAILVTTEADSDFVQFLDENGLYKKVLFLFAEPLLPVTINLFLSTISLFVVKTMVSLHWFVLFVLVLINGFMFLYAVLSIIKLYDVYAMYGTERLHYKKTKKMNEVVE